MHKILWSAALLTSVLALGVFAAAQNYPPMRPNESVEGAPPAGTYGPGQEGYEHGYRDGSHRGQEDHAAGVRSHFQTEDWEHADRGYAKYMGDKNLYKSSYKQGYEVGYNDGYTNHRRFGEVYGRTVDPYYRPGIPPNTEEGYYGTDPNENVYVTQGWPPADVASEVGYRDGVIWAQYDAQHGNAPNPTNNWVYKRGDHGYRSQYGDKGAYKSAYQQAFIQGYEDTLGYRR